MTTTTTNTNKQQNKDNGDILHTSPRVRIDITRL